MPDKNSLVVGVDYETFYHKKQYSIQLSGTPGYLDDPRFDAYLVSVVLYDHAKGPYSDNPELAQEFCGHPSDFDWSCLDLPGITWLSHNKSFDMPVHRKLIEKGIIPPHVYPEEPDQNWFCTADMVSYFALPRALGAVVKHLYGHAMAKDVRDDMNGRHWEDLTPEEQATVKEYALEDSRWLHVLWGRYGSRWPDHERLASNLTIEMGNRGLPCSPEELDGAVKTIQDAKLRAEEAIPWEWPADKTPLSSTALANQCRKDGLPVPASRAKDSLVCQQWIADYGDRAPYVRAVQDWASSNTLTSRLSVMRERCRVDDQLQWGWVPYSMMYCGAHTGRDTGAGGLNVLNMNRTEVQGVDLRKLIQAPPGYVFLSADYSQIEPRVLAWLAGDQEFLDAVRSGVDPYVAFGTVTLRHQGEWDASHRQYWKIMVLGLGYGCGANKFRIIAHQKGVQITSAQSQELVKLYRTRNHLVPKLWTKLERGFKQAAKDRIFTLELPSGRQQVYRNVSILRGLKAVVADESSFQEKTFWGGVLTENLVQAVSRDIFMEDYLEIEAAGMPVVLRIYDEFLILVPETEAEEKQEKLLAIMTTPPEWAPDLPLAAECKILTRYEK